MPEERHPPASGPSGPGGAGGGSGPATPLNTNVVADSASRLGLTPRQTPATVEVIGQQTMQLDGAEVPLRPNIGIFTQPISFIGLPVVVVPIPLKPLPIGVQVIAAPWREDIALRIARALEKERVAVAPRPPE